MPRQTLEERFWSKVDVRGPDECWPWLAGPHTDGYGLFWYEDKSVHAHRVAYFFEYGKFPDNYACHTCNHKRCCNPNHLYDSIIRTWVE